MKNVRKDPEKSDLLRRGAEERLRQSGKREIGNPRASDAGQELVHELQVHKIELEMQNEELILSRAKMETSLERYSELYDFAPVGYFTFAPDAKILQVNLAGARLLGMERAQLVNRPFGLFVSESDRPAFNAFLTNAFESQTQESCELALRNVVDSLPPSQLSGTRRMVQIEGTVGQEGQACRAVVIDITDRKMIEDAHLFLLQSGWSGEDFFQSLARYLAEALEMDYVCIDRLEGDCLSAHTLAIYHNGRFEDNVAYTLKDTPCGEVVGKTICGFPKDVRRLFPKDVVLHRLMAESYLGTTLWSSAGRPIGLIAIISSRPKANFRIAEAILKIAAIRAAGELERRQAEVALRKAKDELEDRVKERTNELQNRAEQLSALASELTQAEIRARNYLASVLHDDLQQLLVSAKFAVSSALMNEEEARVRNSLNQVENLLNQSIDKSRTLTAEISPPILSHGSLVDALRWLAHWMHEKHDLTVDLFLEENVETLQDIRVLLFLAVRELLFNIVKHAGVNQAEVRLERSDVDGLAIVVSDKGKGFDANLMTEPGRIASSFGLLSIQERLQCFGGQFEIVSAPGHGTLMKLFAPIARESQGRTGTTASSNRAPIAQPSLTSLSPISVLLVDDHRTLREALIHLLEKVSDIKVVGEAGDGQQAVDMARHLRPNVVIMDINMPGMNGIDATRIIASECPQCRVIALSMYSEAEMETAMREAGAVNYLIKSGPSSALIDAIRSCVRSGAKNATTAYPHSSREVTRTVVS
jgi:PAS domain S-box-containing protein